MAPKKEKSKKKEERQLKIVRLDQDGEIKKTDLQEIFQKNLEKDKTITLCVRSAKGPQNRGGYFFRLEYNNNSSEESVFLKTTIEDSKIDHTFKLGEIVRFINHVSGRKFDEEMLKLCQTKINLKNDD